MSNMNINDIFYRRDGKRVYIKRPSLQELEYTEKLWGDLETMADVGRVIDFPESKWESFYKKMISPTDGRNFYCLVYNLEDEAVGEVGFHGYDSATKTARLNIRIENKFRRNGYGIEALRIILDYFFNEFGGNYIVETVKDEPYKTILEKEGFKFINKNKQESIYRISKDEFLSTARMRNRRVGFVISPGVDALSVLYGIKLFNRVNEITEEQFFDVITLGWEGKNQDYSGYINFRLDEIITDDYDERLDMVIFPSNNGEESFKSEEILGFVNKYIDNCELMVAQDDSIMALAISGVLKGLKACVPEGGKGELKSLFNTSIISNKNIIDNGRIVLVNGYENLKPGYLYIIKKMCGEKIYKDIVNSL